MSDPISEALFDRAQNRLVGGVNSPVRAFRAVGGSPVFIKSAKGAYLTGADDTQYVDYVGSWGPMILGHADPDVVKAICESAALGTSFGAPTEGEIEMGELIHSLVRSMEMSRLVSSGTEAVMGAIRVARGFTGRDKIVKCVGGYHGGADYLLVKAGSGAATFGVPSSAGVPKSIAETTILTEFNDVAGLRKLFAERGQEIAGVIVEPVAGNMGCVPPADGWFTALSELTKANKSLLIFDEVMTGFRVALGGAQALYGVKPDLTCLGKIVGGGLPVGAYGGRREIMEKVAPLGPVYQAGTLSGNPLAVAAGRATLAKLQAPGTYEKLETLGAKVEAALTAAAQKCKQPVTVQRVGSMLTPFFHDGPVRTWEDAAACDTDACGRFHLGLIANGVHWPPAQFEAGFVSLAHDDEAIEKTKLAAEAAFSAV